MEGDSVTSWDFIKQNYRPGDRVAIVIRNRARNYTLQRLLPTADAAAPRFQRYLRHENATGSDIYISMNTLKPEARGRTKADIATIRHLYLDLDEDGTAKLTRILADPAMPRPNFVLDTSPGKHQVIWQVEGFTLEKAEAALRGMAREFGGDPAATDSTRVLRLPGFHNKKFKEPVRVQGHRLASRVYPTADFSALRMSFRAELIKPTVSGGHDESILRAPYRSAGSRTLSQSERDWAWVKEQLRSGIPPDAVKQTLVERRPDKSKPEYYAERTVDRALMR